MKPIVFKGITTIYAKDQPQYQALPVHKSKDGVVTSCWQLSWRERLRVLLTGKFYLSVMTFNKSLQPLSPSTKLETLIKS